MNSKLKDILGEDFNLDTTLNDILSEELIFLMKYLEGKRNKREKFDQLILVANGFKVNLHDFMDDALSMDNSLYIRTVKKTEKYYKLELTKDGLQALKFASYEKRIIRKGFIWNTLVFFRNVYLWFILKPIHSIPTIFKWIFSNYTVKIILFLAALAGGIIAVIQIYEWYKS